jgi:PAS domain-containing protein
VTSTLKDAAIARLLSVDPTRPALSAEEPALPDDGFDSYVVGEELMRRAFENASIGSYILGGDGRILRVNDAAIAPRSSSGRRARCSSRRTTGA